MNMECSCSCSLVHLCSCSSVLMNMEILSEKTSEINKSRLVRAFQVQISRKLNELECSCSCSFVHVHVSLMFMNIVMNISETPNPESLTEPTNGIFKTLGDPEASGP